MKKSLVFVVFVLLGLFFISASADKMQGNSPEGVRNQKVSAISKPSENDSPVLIVEPCLMNFGVNNLGQTTGPQDLLIHNCGGGTLNWTVVDNATWLECSPTSGTNFWVVEVSLGDLEGLKIGNNRAEITISDPNAAHSPYTLYVTVVLHKHTRPPFGYFDRPKTGVVVNGCVPLTGWALDDLDVECVKIYRKDGSADVFVGNATFVEGARPDVAQLYPDFPHYTRAGWGYNLLSNVLADGPHTFLAKARDKEGNEVTLGEKTIIINNASDVHPFGTIDFPKPGGVISGAYRVHGWALTHPSDTITSVAVVIDSGSPNAACYGDYRPDVCAVFPGYTCYAGFHRDFDTLNYNNGTHTIYGIATDSGTDSSGIGSRYFNIWNLGTLCKTSRLSSKKQFSMSEITDMPLYYSEPVEMKKGFDPNIEPETAYPDETGNIKIEIKELERIEIHLGNGIDNSTYTGYLVVGQQLWPLPIGSTMDTEKGVFYWILGPGFIGEYQLVFVENEPDGAMNKKLVNVKIVSKFGK